MEEYLAIVPTIAVLIYFTSRLITGRKLKNIRYLLLKEIFEDGHGLYPQLSYRNNFGVEFYFITFIDKDEFETASQLGLFEEFRSRIAKHHNKYFDAEKNVRFGYVGSEK